MGGCSEQGCVRRKPATITDRKKGIVSANRWIRMFNQTYEMAVYLISILDTQQSPDQSFNVLSPLNVTSSTCLAKGDRPFCSSRV